MTIACDRCNSPASEKWITSKKNGKSYKVYECLGSCMNGRFKYSFFPPRENAPMQKAAQTQPSEVIERLKRVEKMLSEILCKLGASKVSQITTDELEPDETTPF